MPGTLSRNTHPFSAFATWGVVVKKLLSIAVLSWAFIIAVAMAAPTAQATTIVTATWTGTIRGAQDAGGNFGGTIADGAPVTLTTVFDTSSGTLAGNTITGGGVATLNINSTDHVFALSPSSYGFNAFDSLVMAMGDVGGYKMTANFFAAAFPGSSILQSFDGDCFDVGYCTGEFQILPGWSSGTIDFAHLNIAIATTPIPAALPLFASALAGLGFVARRRKATAAA
jgi:hypothetical protein